jgi:hypothetical protein
MTIYKNLARERWFELSLIEQLANVGADVERTIRWKQKGNNEYSRTAFDRALDLIYLTVEDPKNRGRLREILRTREALIDHFVYDNEYKTTDEQWQKYFYQYNYAAAIKKGR